MNFFNSLLPSSDMNEDITFSYDTSYNIRPINLKNLNVIKPTKKLFLSLRQNHKKITLERLDKKMCLIIPYRNRKEHLNKFIPHIHNYLKKNNINFEIIVVEQDNKKQFNKAKLMNIGSLNTSSDVDYFVFHDVDLLPENIDYRYSNHSLKLFTYIKQDNIYKEYKQTNFGGAILVPKEIFLNINGFSNSYWQRGSEDDDFLIRHLIKGYIPFYDYNGKFKALPHPSALLLDNNGNITNSKEILKKNLKFKKQNSKILSQLKRLITIQEDDGISTINKYKIIDIQEKNLYKLIKVSL